MMVWCTDELYYSMYRYGICAINPRDLFKITSYHYGVNATLHHQGGAQGGKRGCGVLVFDL